MAKNSTQNNDTSKQKRASAKATAKEPLISTRKKVGIAIYFTFLATLAGVIGVQILLSQNFAEPIPTSDPYSTTTTDTQTPQQPETYTVAPNDANTQNTSPTPNTSNLPNATATANGNSTSFDTTTTDNGTTANGLPAPNEQQPSAENLATDNTTPSQFPVTNDGTTLKTTIFSASPIDENAPPQRTATPF